MNWIIDTDAGVDDAVAFALAYSPRAPKEFNVLAVTTVAGNCSLDKVNKNVSAIFDALQTKTPIYVGCDRPLIEPYQDAADFHGVDGLGDAGLAVSTRALETEHGALALVRLAREHAGNIGVIALGPLTNIALACNLDDSFAKNVSSLVVMGGAWRAQGNQTSAGEFNIVVDPESARIVFDRFENIVMLPWEVSLDRMFPFDRMNALATAGTARADFYYRMTRMGVKNLAAIFKLSGFPAARSAGRGCCAGSDTNHARDPRACQDRYRPRRWPGIDFARHAQQQPKCARGGRDGFRPDV